jgi:ankyrin repeat protein
MKKKIGTLILQESPWTPLMAAVKTNQVEVVDYLLDKKVSTAPVPFSSTALHLAAERNHFECIRLLLRHNALVDPLKGKEICKTCNVLPFS